jgi:sugar lactone lactonase YvrE
VILGMAVATAGCLPPADSAMSSTARLERVWGTRGERDGELQKPRALTIDEQDRLFIVDYTARIQVFTTDGRFLRGWRTPISEVGRPTGMSMGIDGNLLVADTHYHRILVYTPEGELLPERTIGGTNGSGPGEFSFVNDVVQDSQGNYYTVETHLQDRVQKFSPDGQFIKQWGSSGDAPGSFLRPRAIVADDQDRLWIADACNHRIQVFDSEGNLVRVWGAQGSAPGQLYYPYDLLLDGLGHVYVCEYGNHRVQKFSLEGESLGVWGTNGRQEGQMNDPWGIVRDSAGRIHVLDTDNHRVQRILM